MGDSSTAGSRAASSAGTTLMRNFETEINRPAPIYNRSLYAGAPGTLGASAAGAPGLRQAMDWNSGLMTNGGFNDVQRSAMDSMQSVLDETGRNAPGAAAVRRGISDTTLDDVAGMFSNSGRFGGGGHVRTATDQLASNLSEFDLNQYNTAQDRRAGASSAMFGMGQQGIANGGAAAAAAPGLFEASLRPGQIADTDAQARLMGDYDLWDRTNNGNTDRLAQFMGMLNGSQNMPGTQTQTPWWQQALGGATALAGAFF